jgi:hypothetical protein
MNRINEDGTNAGMRNIGRLALFLIPWALALGAAAWIGVYIGAHDFRHQLSQEERAATYTGASEKPKDKFKIVIEPHDCSHITKADIDGHVLLLYARNDCHKTLDYLAWHWQEVSPNGTIISGGYQNNAYCPVPQHYSEIAECSQEISDDDRAVQIKLWTQIEP